jgi:uncharacterized protein YbjT (DUF2867 family)
MSTNVLITGATGQVGQVIVKALGSNPTIHVRAAVRNVDKAKRLIELGAKLIHFDYDEPATYAPALEGVEQLLLLTGYSVSMLKHSKWMIDQARNSDVKHIVHVGAHSSDNTDNEHHGWHQFVERYIEWSGLNYTHLRPGAFMQTVVALAGDGLHKEPGQLTHYIGDGAMSWIDTGDLAAVAAAVLCNPDAHVGQTYPMFGDTKSIAEIAEILTRTTGRPFVYNARPIAELKTALGNAGFEPTYAASVIDEVQRVANGTLPPYLEGRGTIERITGQPATTWADFADKYPHLFKLQLKA